MANEWTIEDGRSVRNLDPTLPSADLDNRPPARVIAAQASPSEEKLEPVELPHVARPAPKRVIASATERVAAMKRAPLTEHMVF